MFHRPHAEQHPGGFYAPIDDVFRRGRGVHLISATPRHGVRVAPWSARVFWWPECASTTGCGKLYVAHVFLFHDVMATVAYTVGALNNSLYVEEFGAAISQRAGPGGVKALKLQFQPAFHGILRFTVSC